MLPRNQLRNWRDLTTTFVFFLLFTILLGTNAWVVDDAYITFRTIDNFVHGYGLTWNVDERVQVYTHPLWMFVVSLFYFITSELFFTVVLLSGLLTLAAVLLAWATVTNGFRDSIWKGYLFMLSIMASKAIMDYASSGLENCMSYLIAAVFLSRLIHLSKSKQVDEGKVFALFLLASLAFLNRADTVLLYIPALLYLMYLSRHLPYRRLGRAILIATIPATGWLLFSLVYYGYPFPNTAYAKVLSTGYPFEWKLHRGVEYLSNSIIWDSASHVIVACAVLFALKKRSWTHVSLIAGVLLYVCFVVTSAASATHMSGRFFALPFFVATILFADNVPSRRFAVAACACLVAFIAWSPVSAVKFGTPLYQPYDQNPNFIDTKWFVFNEGAALLNWRPGKKMPDHGWYHYGKALRSRPERVFLGGARGGEAIGYTGFAAGPTKHFVDRVALSDPLLSKLPAYRPDNIEKWKSGHFHRTIPPSYMESLVTGMNLISDPGFRRYYDYVRTITQGQVWDWNRFAVILNMNLGKYEYLLEQAEQGAEGDAVHRAP